MEQGGRKQGRAGMTVRHVCSQICPTDTGTLSCWGGEPKMGNPMEAKDGVRMEERRARDGMGWRMRRWVSGKLG